MGSNPAQGMSGCVFSVFMLGSGLATGSSPVQGVYRLYTIKGLKETKYFTDAFRPEWERQEYNKNNNKKKKAVILCLSF
jgi:hypothetical protein